MPPLADCYVLVDSRSKDLVGAFLAHFLPRRRNCAAAYEVPQYSGAPAHVFSTAGAALAYLELHPGEAHALYWENAAGGEPRCGMCFPAEDGRMILGLACRAAEEGLADGLLDDMRRFLHAPLGYIAYEQPPPRTVAAFLATFHSLAGPAQGEP